MIGKWIDGAIACALSTAGKLAERALAALAPADFDEKAADRFLAADQLADAEEDYEVAEPLGEHPDIDPRAVIAGRPDWSGIGVPPDQPASAGAPQPPDAGTGGLYQICTSGLLTAAAKQLDILLRAQPDRGGYLGVLIPELRDRAAQYAEIDD